MFVVTLNKASLKKFGIGAMCCALVAFSALLGRYISTRTVSVSASGNKIESAQDIQTWFTGYGLDVDGASITADKVKIPRKWDDSFSAFNGVVQQTSGEDYSGDWGERHDEELGASDQAQQTSGEDYSGDWGERHDEELSAADQAQQTSGEDYSYTDLPLDAEGYPVE